MDCFVYPIIAPLAFRPSRSSYVPQWSYTWFPQSHNVLFCFLSLDLSQGPLLQVPHFSISMVKWCAMHVVHLGCDLWLVGNALKTILIDTELWGSGHDDERLLNAWLEFKAWARQNKWQPLAQIQSGHIYFTPVAKLSDNMGLHFLKGTLFQTIWVISTLWN